MYYLEEDDDIDGIDINSLLDEKINLKNSADVEYWSIKLDCAEDELFDAVYTVGLEITKNGIEDVRVKDVKEYLDKKYR